MEAAFQAVQTAAIEVVFESIDGITATKIEVAEHHSTKMGQMRDTALTGRERGVERDRADNPNEVLHLERE